MREKDDQQDQPAEVGAFTVLGMGTALLLGIAVLTLSMVRTADLGPHVGDIVEFDRGRTIPDGMRSAVHPSLSAAPGATCEVAPATVSEGGGSFVVEAKTQGSPYRYRVHWAGKRTSPGSGDCGASADLLLNQGDLLSIAQAAGGFGVSHKRLVLAAGPTAGMMAE